MESNVTAEPTTPESSGQDVPAGINPAYAEKETTENKPKAPSESKEQKEQEKMETALRKLKVRGKEIEVDDSKYHEYAQKGAAATETWQEAARIKREAEAFINDLKTNPLKVMKDPNLGVDFRKIAEEYLWEQIQEEQLSPEQKQRREMEREIQTYREKEQAAKQAEEQAKSKELHDHYASDYDKKITSALSVSGLPKTTGTVRRMTDYMLIDVRNGIERDPSEYVQFVREDYMNDLKELFSQTVGDTLLNFLGDGNAKKIRESDLKRVQKTTQPAEGHTFVPGKGMVPNKPAKKLGGFDWERQVRKEMMGR